MSSRILISVRVRATPARAFEVFTGQIGSWWRASQTFRFTPRDGGRLSFEPGEGGRLIETLPDGKVFQIGRVTLWDPPAEIAFGWRQATFAPDQDTLVTVRFEAVGEETRVTIEHTGWDSVPAGHAARHGFSDALFSRLHAEWWQTLLSSYKAAT